MITEAADENNLIITSQIPRPVNIELKTTDGPLSIDQYSEKSQQLPIDRVINVDCQSQKDELNQDGATTSKINDVDFCPADFSSILL